MEEESGLIKVRKEKLREIREDLGINPYPYKYDVTDYSAGIIAGFDESLATPEIREHCRPDHDRAGHGQGELLHHPGPRRQDTDLCLAERHRRRKLRALQEAGHRGHHRREGHGEKDEDRRNHRLRHRAHAAVEKHPAASRGEGKGRRGLRRIRGQGAPLPEPSRGPDRHPGREGNLRQADRHHQADKKHPRRKEFFRGRNAGAPARVRRRRGLALHLAPQRAGHHALPAHLPRALPQAAHRGRVRPRVRDRQVLPQRGD